jgi:hypothetical protein
MNSTLQPLHLETQTGRHAAQRQDTRSIEFSTVPNLVWQVWLLAIAFHLITMIMTAMEVLA